MNLGLHRIAAVMQALGSPHLRFRVLHIAGTNGKGSVAAMAESVLRAGRRKTGLYTSPHLERLEERIRVSGRNISPRRFAAVAARVFETEAELLARNRLDIRLTYFEVLTACAFLHFAQQAVDVAVVEVGLGGRLDATNIVHPRACVITGISYDHQDLLGATLQQIAAEKAGIMKPGVPAISGCRAAAVRGVIRAEARRLGATLLEIDRACRLRIVSRRGPRVTVDLQTPRRRYRHVRLALAGLHQARNAMLAVAAVEALEGRALSEALVRRALAATRWPGRLDEYAARRRTLLEAAHNEEGARALREHLRRCVCREIHLVFAALRDKDIRKMGALLFPLARSVHLAPVANSRTSLTSEIVRAHPRYRARLREHARSGLALRAAWEECPRDGLVVVTGSLYLLGELLPMVRASVKKTAR